MTFLPSSRGLYLAITASTIGWYLAMTFSAFSLIVSSKRAAILRRDSAICDGPKKLYSIHGIPNFSSMWRAM